MLYGIVKWFGARNEHGGEAPYGFIQGMDGQDYHVHAENILDENRLSEREPVVFIPVQTRRGLSARDVRPVKELVDPEEIRRFLIQSLEGESTLNRQPLVHQYLRKSYEHKNNFGDLYAAGKDLLRLELLPTEGEVDIANIVKALQKVDIPQLPIDDIPQYLHPYLDATDKLECWKQYGTPPPDDLFLTKEDFMDLLPESTLAIIKKPEHLASILIELTNELGENALVHLYHFLDGCRRANFKEAAPQLSTIWIPKNISDAKKPALRGDAVDATKNLVWFGISKGIISGSFRYIPYILDLDDNLALEVDPSIHPPKILPPAYQRQVFKRLIFQHQIEKCIQLSSLFLDSSVWDDYTILFLLSLKPQAIKGNNVDRYIIKQAIESRKPWHKNIRLLDIFETCPGRMNYDKRDKTYYRLKKSAIIDFCEGSSYLKKDVVESEEGFNYIKDGDDTYRVPERERWWCFNQVCHLDVSYRTKRIWHEVSLKDYLGLIGCCLDWEHYKNIISYINQFNRFAEKMKCRSCGEYMNILDEKSERQKLSVYAYNRLVRFSCDAEGCENPDKEVYLSHCLNRRHGCLNIVDSRCSEKCKPEGHDQKKCGWYICDHCFSCCKSSVLLFRKRHLDEKGIVYNCHLDGHWDQGKICCLQCGSVLSILPPVGSKAPFTQMMLDFLNKQHQLGEASGLIRKTDVRTTGQLWFLVDAQALTRIVKKRNHDLDSYLSMLIRNGFSIKVGDEDGRYYNSRHPTVLITAPSDRLIDGLLHCDSCGFHLDLGNLPYEDDENSYRLKLLSKHRAFKGDHITPTHENI